MDAPLELTFEAEPIDPNVAKMEAAARIYCSVHGMDADKTMQIPHPAIVGLKIDSPPFWHEVACRMLDLNIMLAAIRQAHVDEMVGNASSKSVQ